MKAKGDYPESRLLRLYGSQDGLHERWTKTTQGVPSGSSLFRSDDFRYGQAGRLDRLRNSRKTVKANLNLKGDYKARVHLGQMVLMVVRQGG
jgi:hypothetical protein